MSSKKDIKSSKRKNPRGVSLWGFSAYKTGMIFAMLKEICMFEKQYADNKMYETYKIIIELIFNFRNSFGQFLLHTDIALTLDHNSLCLRSLHHAIDSVL